MRSNHKYKLEGSAPFNEGAYALSALGRNLTAHIGELCE